MAREVAMFLVLVAVWMGSARSRDPVLHRVGGGKYTWGPGFNFSNWAAQQQFYVGDWLYFGFNKTLHNVLEVNKTSYDQCRGDSFITNITRGGRDVFNLTHPKSYYFICSRCTHCSLLGMKVQVLVTDPPQPLQLQTSDSPPHPTPTNTYAAAIYLSSFFVFNLLSHMMM